jgi:cell division septation protein DedD
MADKDYRELQLSSSQLVLIFLGIIILGIVIFLLGVSVGKKQAQIVKESQIVSDNTLEEVQEEKPIPPSEQKGSINKELESHARLQKESQEKPSPAVRQNLYYIQIGAFREREAASQFAATFKKKGYNLLVLDPFPTDKINVYRVRIGGYDTREQAEEAKQELVRTEKTKRSDYFVVRY